MNRSVRVVAASVTGVVAASACIMAVEALGHAALSGRSLFGAALVALGLGAFIGGWTASRVGGSPRFTWAIGGILAVLSLINISSFPHPGWFPPAAAAALVVGSGLAFHFASQRKPARD